MTNNIFNICAILPISTYEIIFCILNFIGDYVKNLVRQGLLYSSARQGLSYPTQSLPNRAKRSFLLSFGCIFRLYRGAPPFGVVVNVSFHYNTEICGMCIKQYIIKCLNATEMSFIQYLHVCKGL